MVALLESIQLLSLHYINKTLHGLVRLEVNVMRIELLTHV